MCCSMACAAFAWATWINLIDSHVRLMTQTKAPGYEAGVLCKLHCALYRSLFGLAVYKMLIKSISCKGFAKNEIVPLSVVKAIRLRYEHV